MKVVFRVDGNREAGMGHIVRCIALAKDLCEYEVVPSIEFLTAHEEARDIMESEGFRVFLLASPEFENYLDHIDVNTILITDLLKIDDALAQRLRPMVKRLVCIDNSVEPRKLAAHVVVNANVFGQESDTGREGTECHFGPDYMILRREFDTARRKGPSDIVDQVGSVLVMFGGSDPKEATGIILETLEPLKDVPLTAVLGPGYTGTLDGNCGAVLPDNWKIMRNPKDLLGLMEGTDLAITGAGITLFELAYLGVPCLVIPQVEHQEIIARAFEKAGACINLGANPGNNLIYEATMGLIEDPDTRRRMSECGKALVDGKGRQRVVDIIKECL